MNSSSLKSQPQATSDLSLPSAADSVRRHFSRLIAHSSFWGILLFNAVPFVGGVFFDWAAFDIMILYWLECGVVGISVIIRLLTLGWMGRSEFVKPTQVVSKRVGRTVVFLWLLFCSCFFVVHYGFLWAYAGLFTFGALSSIQAAPQIVSKSFSALVLSIAKEVWPGLLAIFLSQLFSFYWNFLRNGEFRKINEEDLMIAPYPQLLLVFLSSLVAGIAVALLQLELILIVAYVLVMSYVELLLHSAEREQGVVFRLQKRT